MSAHTNIERSKRGVARSSRGQSNPGDENLVETWNPTLTCYWVGSLLGFRTCTCAPYLSLSHTHSVLQFLILTITKPPTHPSRYPLTPNLSPTLMRISHLFISCTSVTTHTPPNTHTRRHSLLNILRVATCLSPQTSLYISIRLHLTFCDEKEHEARLTAG